MIDVWTGNIKDTAYLFYQGKGSTQIHAAKYTGKQPIITTTGEEVVYYKSDVYAFPPQQAWLYPEIPEVNRNPLFTTSSSFHKVKEIFITPKSDYQSYKPFYPTNEDGSIDRYTIDSSKSSLGQSTDIAAHKKKYDEMTKCINVKKKVLFGVSRGAKTTFSALALNEYKDINLCVLEGVPGTIRGLFKSYFSAWIGKLLYNKVIAYLFLGRQHKTDKAMQARAHVDKFPNNVPLVITSSRKDGVVPHKISMRLALRVAAKRIKAMEQGEDVAPVYFLQLDHSGHNQYTKEIDGKRYQNFLHAVYKKHNLPYINEFATQGECEFATAELTKGNLQEQVKQQVRFWDQRENRQAIRTEALQTISNRYATGDLTAREVKMCIEMPLFFKHRNPSFFNTTTAQKKLEMLEGQLPVIGSGI